jgi:hypothetical protein
VFCTTALFTWKLDATDVSRMAGHANYRITLDMYVGSTVGVLDRARSHRVTVPAATGRGDRSRELPGSSLSSRRNSMSLTDLRHADFD